MSKQELSEKYSETDIRTKFIVPAITKSGWDIYSDQVREEFPITNGKIILNGHHVKRGKPKEADYILFNKSLTEILAVIEAKKYEKNTPASIGLQQAMGYAQALDIKFAYSSNGNEFIEHDFLTGKERIFSIDEFPTCEELTERLKKESNNGQGLNSEEIKIIEQPYYSSQNTYPPRYYQRLAVNKTLSAIAKGQKRILLVMATGTGKTYTAFQIVYRLLKSQMKKKILYLADRNVLVDQSIQQDFAPLEKSIHKIQFKNEDKTTITSHEVYFSLYQQLDGGGDDDEKHFKQLFKPDFFDLVIVDECHRGSADAEGQWREILDYFSSATHIGMTATPKETQYISNTSDFGEPVYKYSLKEGIDDGFLAPFRVINVKTNIGDNWRPYKGQLDKNGVLIEDRIYSNKDYDYNIIIEDRTYEVAKEITDFLKSTDRMSKTIVFCADEKHAERMRTELVNLNQDMVKENPDYVVRITGSDEYGKSKLDYFISASQPYPVIATTAELLATGVDCKMVKLIVLDKNISSMIEFKQIIGRGTRLLPDKGKTHFTVMDFRNVTRLFADPDWDGEIEMDENFHVKDTPKPKSKPVDSPSESQYKCVVDEKECQVIIMGREVSIYDPNNKLLRKEDIIDYTKTNIIGKYASLKNFIQKWSSTEKKEEIRNLLEGQGINLEKLKEEKNMTDVDDFDFICHVAFDQKPLTRKERVNNVKKRDFFTKYGGAARNVLEALLDKYMDRGIYEVENMNVLKLHPFDKIGTLPKIASLFGGKDKYFAAIKELENELYKAG